METSKNKFFNSHQKSEEISEIRKIKLHEVLTCKENETVESIAEKLKEKKERRIFVVDKEEKLVGIITTTDLVYKVLVNKKDLKARDVMTKNVRSVEDNENLEEALEIMNELKSFVCPVTKKGKILGLISYHDLVGYVLNSMQED